MYTKPYIEVDSVHKTWITPNRGVRTPTHINMKNNVQVIALN